MGDNIDNKVVKVISENQKMVSCAKSTILGLGLVVVLIFIFGAMDLYWSMSWAFLKDFISLGRTSLWLPCLAGIGSTAIGCWAICSIVKSVHSWEIWVVVLVSFFSWCVCFSAANMVVNWQYLEGFLLWAYIALFIPVAGIIGAVCAGLVYVTTRED